MKASNDAVGLAASPRSFGTRHLGAIAGVANAAAVLCAPLVQTVAHSSSPSAAACTPVGSKSEAIWLVYCLAGHGNCSSPCSFTAQGHARLATTSESEPPSPHASPVLKAATSRQLIKELKRLSSQRSAAI